MVHSQTGFNVERLMMEIMKKLFYLISMIALMGSVVSCDKLNDANTSVDGFTTLKISASVPQTDMTKTYLKDSKVQWTANDVITVLAPGTDPVMSSLCSGAAETCDFEVQNWPETVTPLYAVFNGPGYNTVESTEYENYQRYSPVLDDDDKITVTLRTSQVIYQKSTFSKVANISVGELTAKDAGYSAEMKNVCGLIMFTLESDAKEVNITDINGGPMTGKVKLVVEDELPKVCEVVTPNSTVTLTSNIKDTDKTLVKGTYYACVLPGTFTPKITVTPVEGEAFTLTANSSVEIKRNKYVDFGTLAPKQIEPVPVETLTITVDMTGENPFTENLRGSQKPEYVEYTLLEGGYKFGFYNAYKSGTHIRLTGEEGVLGYVKFPIISDFKLTNITLSTGATKSKYIRVWSGDPLTAAKEFTGFTLEANAIDQSQDLENTEAGVGYYISAISKNAQFSKLVLTYVKYGIK